EVAGIVVPGFGDAEPSDRRGRRVLDRDLGDERRALAAGRRLHVVDLRVALDRRRELLPREHRFHLGCLRSLSRWRSLSEDTDADQARAGERRGEDKTRAIHNNLPGNWMLTCVAQQPRNYIS